MNSTTPINLSEVPPVTDPAVVELLEEWLARARAGDVRSLAIAADLNDGTVRGVYSLHGSRPDLLFAVGQLNRMLWGDAPTKWD